MTKALLLSVFLALPAAAAEPPQAAPSGVALPAQTPQQNRGNKLMEFYIPQALLAAAVLIAASEALQRKAPGRARAVRNCWNWLLLVSFMACALLGLALMFPLDRGIKGLVVHAHIWTGVAALAAGAYHAAKRFRAMR
jgi:hypothetical protein